MIKRIIVAGTNSFENYGLISDTLDQFLSECGDDIEIISGHAAGPDQLGERYAKEHSLKCTVFPAEWKKYGRAAGPIRNAQMLSYALEAEPAVIVFWDGKSRGTSDMINKAKRKGAEVRIIAIA